MYKYGDSIEWMQNHHGLLDSSVHETSGKSDPPAAEFRWTELLLVPFEYCTGWDRSQCGRDGEEKLPNLS
jgi:hypothetical protein